MLLDIQREIRLLFQADPGPLMCNRDKEIFITIKVIVFHNLNYKKIVDCQLIAAFHHLGKTKAFKNFNK